MKRSQHIKLVLVSTLPFAISACSGPVEQTKTVTASKTFANMQECISAKVPSDVCSNSYIMALNEHKRIAPKYNNETDCVEDFMPGYCAQDSSSMWIPRLGGFQITTAHDVKYRQNESGEFVQVDPPAPAAAAGAGSTVINNGGSGDGFLTGLILGNMMSNNGGPRYISEPVYSSRDGRGDFRKSTINERVNAGKTFNKSEQVKSGGDYKQKSMTQSLSNRSNYANSSSKPSYNSSSYENRSYNSNSTRSTANSASKSTGGFGSVASARSSFGGSFGG